MKILQFMLPDTNILYCGDTLEFKMVIDFPTKGKAFLRTNIGRSAIHYDEIVQASDRDQELSARDWYDIPMSQTDDNSFSLKLALTETGMYSAKIWFLPENDDKPQWASGENSIFKVEAARNVGANTLYSLFVRQFGANMHKKQSNSEDETVRSLDEKDYTVIPPSGTFRSVIKQLDFIIGKLNSRIIQLLPIHPTPTVYGRMGRFGSAFASLDYFSVDSALAEFDKKTTPLGQFIELLDAAHMRGARVFMDIPVNHTGWASCLHAQHPDWFVKDAQDGFVSPGAWGIEWSDLSQLDYSNPEVAEYMAEVFLYWLRLGVDGFRCDAGYKLPYKAWEYINAKIRLEYPDAVLLLEGLGGLLDKQEVLLKSKGLNWAYSELFQNYDRGQIEQYFSYVDRINREAGLMVHYAETHDNNRLAAESASYAKMRITLSALLSYNGSFGITNGVEWLAEEKVNVHGASGLNWGSDENLIEEISRLQTLLIHHPLFYRDTVIRFINRGNDNTLVFIREQRENKSKLLNIINLDSNNDAQAQWNEDDFPVTQLGVFDLISGDSIDIGKEDHLNSMLLKPHQSLCLTTEKDDLKSLTLFMANNSQQEELWRQQGLYALILKIIDEFQGIVLAQDFNIEEYAELWRKNPNKFYAKVSGKEIPPITRWNPEYDEKRVVLLPQDDMLLIESAVPFRAEIKDAKITLEQVISLPLGDKHIALFRKKAADSQKAEYRQINITLYEDNGAHRLSGKLLLLPVPKNASLKNYYSRKEVIEKDIYTIAGNESGGMSQIRAAWGYLHSKYDALLAANCHPNLPVDRRVMFTRCRAWIVYNDYSKEINLSSLNSFIGGVNNRAQWNFTISVGQGELIDLTIGFEMAPKGNAISLTFFRHLQNGQDSGLEDKAVVKLILRPDIEDRINHEVTKALYGEENSFPQAIKTINNGFIFNPNSGKSLKILTNGKFEFQPEWKYMEFLKEENQRGLEDHTDLFSPGFFELYLRGGDEGNLSAAVYDSQQEQIDPMQLLWSNEKLKKLSSVEETLKTAMERFIVKRDNYKTVIAGYPWFLDWGRDTLIALRGMISAGYLQESREIIIQFATFEEQGTIPNVIRGGDVSNRETADAPLWLFIAVKDYVQITGNDSILKESCGERTLIEVLESILSNYQTGTPNGIKMDEDSGLVFSPSHFTWMDTNYPAGTPREGYPVEIQVFWAVALRFMGSYSVQWKELYEQVLESINQYYWIEEKEYLADCLHAAAGTPAKMAHQGDAVRPNQLFAVTFDILKDRERQKGVINACEQLLIPGAIRSLADREVDFSLPVYRDGQLINDPKRPFWGRYEGDEDSRRKPAYHNGTAWSWPFPSYCEALYKIGGKEARDRALSILFSSKEIIDRGCVGQIAEVFDGYAPHSLRGCGAQAWGATEFYRVFELIIN